MNCPDNFAQSLRRIQQEGNMSLTKFAEALRVPKSTLQSILKHGQTSLETACRISEVLSIPLSVLVDDVCPQTGDLLKLLQSLNWYSSLSREGQEAVAKAMVQILEVMKYGTQGGSPDPDRQLSNEPGTGEDPESAA